jgi:hypothetical protein
MDFMPLLSAIALVAVIIDVARSARGGDWNGVITPLVAWGVGVLVAFTLGESDFGESIPLGDSGHTFASVNGFSMVLVGFALGSLASKGVDLLKAIDGSDSQKRPSLVENPPPT